MSILQDMGTKIGTELKSSNNRITTLENAPTGNGVVLQVKVINISNTITFASTTWTDSGLTLTITPKSTTSRFIVSAWGQSSINTTSTSGGIGTNLRMVKDSVEISRTRWQNYLNSIDYSSDFYPTVQLKRNFTTSTLTPFTIKIQGQTYGTDRPWRFNDTNGGASNLAELIITEIEEA